MIPEQEKRRGLKLQDLLCGEESSVSEHADVPSPGNIEAGIAGDYKEGDFPRIKRTNIRLKEDIDFTRHMSNLRAKLRNRELDEDSPDFQQ